MADANKIVTDLTAQASPVRPLAPPMIAAVLWFGGIVTAVALAALTVGDVTTFARKLVNLQFLTAWSASLVAGAAATIAAFHLSRPDRTWAWALLPWPAVAVWLWFTGKTCFDQWVVRGPSGFSLGESAMCFGFVLVIGSILGVTLMTALRRGYPGYLHLFIVTLGLATASMAAAALPLFHSIDSTFLDLAAHVMATALLIVLVGRSAALAR